jgi:formate hydrogenlyase transcriptional activator
VNRQQGSHEQGGSNRPELFSIENVLRLEESIFAGSPLPEVLANISRLVEAQAEGMVCTIWLFDEERNELHCSAAPSLAGFASGIGTMAVGPKGGSCGAAVYRREPVYATDILTDPIWEDYRDQVAPYGIRSVWSRPLFTSQGKILGTFAMLYREVRSPNNADVQLIENASHITGIAIERHRNEEELRREHDRLRLLLEITNSMGSKLNLRGLLDALSTNLLRVTRSDLCALLLPDPEGDSLRVAVLYNPEPRGAISSGTILPLVGSICGKAFRTGEQQHFNRLEELRDDPDISGSNQGRQFYQRMEAEGLRSGCDFPLVGRSGVVGVLSALKRSEMAFAKDDVEFLRQASQQVAIAVENALAYETAVKDRDKESKQRRYFEEELRADFGEIIGQSPALKTAMDMVSVVAPTDSSVLILGETGTGKELVARAIHGLSSRRDRAFVKLNCATIPLGLLEGELFGGSVAQKPGRFELADEGTLFLDEVGDIPAELQAKLLRVLQDEAFEEGEQKMDVRLIAATHRDLATMVKQGTFREDLYYRLNVFPIHVPSLRERQQDIPELVRHFTAMYGGRMNKNIHEISTETIEALVHYAWPGNVRELQNFIERAVILSPRTSLCAPISELQSFGSEKKSQKPLTGLAEVEREHILRALAASNWVIGGRNGAAALLGMKRTSLVYRMQKLRINRGETPSDPCGPGDES